ncbi:hypothetical protein BJV78DRAFT_1135861 [Lactifluus subvellereus]|nr:hypothetical protein BJV78DRAFT_1135861 [Lactifluus subvellereus]
MPRTQNQGLQEESDFSDGSGALFSMYLERADEEDKKMVESWKGDADGILVFVGPRPTSNTSHVWTLKGCRLVCFLLQLQHCSPSVPDIRPNSQDTTAFYVASMDQLLSQNNGINISIPPALTNPASSFTPPPWAVWVNGLWFLSLVISLACALLATLLQQWARRYLRVTCPRYSPHKRARVRAFYADGVEKLHLPWTVEMLPLLLHISLFLFFAGLSVFLFSVNLTIFKVVIAWVGLCVIVYAGERGCAPKDSSMGSTKVTLRT